MDGWAEEVSKDRQKGRQSGTSWGAHTLMADADNLSTKVPAGCPFHPMQPKRLEPECAPEQLYSASIPLPTYPTVTSG